MRKINLYCAQNHSLVRSLDLHKVEKASWVLACIHSSLFPDCGYCATSCFKSLLSWVMGCTLNVSPNKSSLPFFFFNFNFLFVGIFLPVCISVHHAYAGQKRVFILLELELQPVMSHVGAGDWAQVLWKSNHVLDHWAVSPAHILSFWTSFCQDISSSHRKNNSCLLTPFYLYVLLGWNLNPNVSRLCSVCFPHREENT